MAKAKPVTFPHLEKEKAYKCKMGKTFMVILPGVNVVVEFYSRYFFFLISGGEGEIPLSHTGHYTNTPLQTHLTVLSCGLNGL